jgi:nitrogen-specific signal transduction histidine kinase
VSRSGDALRVPLAINVVTALAVVVLVGLMAVDIRGTRMSRITGAETGLSNIADVLQDNVRQNLESAMHAVGDMAATLNPDRLADSDYAPVLASMLDRVRRQVPPARFAALLDGRGRKVAASPGQPGGKAAQAAYDGVARLRNQPGDDWVIQGRPPDPGEGTGGMLIVARRLAGVSGETRGIVLVGISSEWLDQLIGRMSLGSESLLVLFDGDGRIMFQAPGGPLHPLLRLGASQVGADAPVTPRVLTMSDGVSRLVVERSVLPDQLRLLIGQGWLNVVFPWWEQAAVTVALGMLGCFLLGAVTVMLRRLVQQLQAVNTHHMRQLSQLATASERLSRLRNAEDIAARAESIARTLLACDDARLTLGHEAHERPPGPDAAQDSITLLGSNGTRLGRLTVSRSNGDKFSSEDELVLEQFVRAVSSSLENATLLADTMQAKSEMELILSTVSDGMVTLDRQWCFRYVNNAAARYLQRPRQQMMGGSWWDLFPGTRESELGRQFEYACRTGQDVSFEAYYPPLKAWYEVRGYPFSGGITVYFRDITVQRETVDKLRQSQKLEAIGQLTGGIAHDVNNLLTVIMGNLELLSMRAEERGADNPEEAELDLTLSEAGLRAGESASQLMHRLLAFSRQQPLSPQVVGIAELLNSLEPMMRRTLGEQMTLQMNLPERLWNALVDPSELESAILNLAINAKDAMPNGGTLTIEAGNVAIDRVYATVAGLDRTGDFIMISVGDTGTGMTREVLARAFDPFFTTKGAGKGTGLGLSMVYGFARQSGGHVLIDSEVGHGTIVRIYLPRTIGSQTAVTETRGGIEGGNELILLVEDNDLVRAHTEAMLRGLGYAVVAAGDGNAARQVLEGGLQPQLLLTDVILPGGMTGRDVADLAARKVPGLRVLFTSGYSGTILSQNGRLTPGVELLGKPFRRSELASRIRIQLAASPWEPSEPDPRPDASAQASSTP